MLIAFCNSKCNNAFIRRLLHRMNPALSGGELAILYHLGKSLKWVLSRYVVTEGETDELNLLNGIAIFLRWKETWDNCFFFTG